MAEEKLDHPYSASVEVSYEPDSAQNPKPMENLPEEVVTSSTAGGDTVASADTHVAQTHSYAAVEEKTKRKYTKKRGKINNFNCDKCAKTFPAAYRKGCHVDFLITKLFYKKYTK